MPDAIELEDVGVVINQHRILDGIRWRVANGQRAALLGPNGSGKTTLLRVITGYQFPTVGKVGILGFPIGRTPLDALRRQIGMVDPTLIHIEVHRLTVLDLVLSGYFGHLCMDFDQPTDEQVAAARTMLADVGLLESADRRLNTLSTGEQRRALLARALAPRPRLLVLDEPTAGLDLLGRETLLATIDQASRQRQDLTLLLVTHHLEELLPATDNVLLLSHGRCAAQGRPQIVLKPENLSRAFEVPVEVQCQGDRWTWRVHPRAWPNLL